MYYTIMYIIYISCAPPMTVLMWRFQVIACLCGTMSSNCYLIFGPHHPSLLLLLLFSLFQNTSIYICLLKMASFKTSISSLVKMQVLGGRKRSVCRGWALLWSPNCGLERRGVRGVKMKPSRTNIAEKIPGHPGKSCFTNPITSNNYITNYSYIPHNSKAIYKSSSTGPYTKSWDSLPENTSGTGGWRINLSDTWLWKKLKL